MPQDDTPGRDDAERLSVGQRLETVGQLAAGIAHEINTPTQYLGDNLRFLRDSCAELLEAEIDPSDRQFLMDEIPAAIADCLEGVERIARIVAAMREFSHPGVDEVVEADVNATLRGALTLSHHAWKYVADVVTELDPAGPRVLCRRGELHQVVLNLLVNAAHAIADCAEAGDGTRGSIVVRSRGGEDFVEVDIEDTGPGIPEAIRGRIFDTFFTTKAVGRGTGQGLAIARSLVERNGGSLTFCTAEGEGTTFTVRLPRGFVELGSGGGR